MIHPAAQLIFAADQSVSLPDAARIIRTHPDMAPCSLAAGRRAMTQLAFTGRTARVSLSLRLKGECNVLDVVMTDATRRDEAEQLARLARLVYALARELPVNRIAWPGATPLIPREAFLQGLAQSFGDRERAGHGGAAPVAPVAPRRIAAMPARRPRPARSAAPSLARLLPRPEDTHTQPVANVNAGVGQPRFDDHVQAFEAHLRRQLRREASQEELANLQRELPVPVEARLSTWAVSLTAATIYLPVALPVMAYNLARGEDMRFASLGVALAGLFFTLDQNGTVAAVLNL